MSPTHEEASDPRDSARARLAAAPWPAALLAVLATLRDGGGRAYLVGGTVRDVLLGRPVVGRFDVATDRTPDEVRARFARTEPIGLAHGTVLVLDRGIEVECTTFRTEGGYADARRPDAVAFTGDLLADLARRDLTVNALAFDPATGALEDPHGGAADLAAGVLRAVGDPAARFAEDALRPLRVARFAATLGMTVEPATRAALAIPRARAARVALERVGGELERLLAGARPSVGLALLREAGLLALWMPELDRCAGVTQNRFHAHDVLTHSLLACDAAPADRPRVRWAALLHDVGKPDTRVVRDGEATFHGHATVGATLADAALERLRRPGAERAAIVHLVREHMFDYRPEWTDGAVRRWIRRVGEDAMDDLFALRAADAAATGAAAGDPSDVGAFRARIARVLADSRALTVRDLAVDGGDAMRELGVPPGPDVGRALAALLEEVLDRPEQNRRETLIERLRAMRGPASSAGSEA